MVEKIKPPITTIPIETRLSDPAPKARAMGNVPKTVESEVIKIGLNLEADASKMDSV